MDYKDSFEKMLKVNVNDKVEKKGRFTYLSWAFAWEELQKNCPGATKKVYCNDEGLPFFASKHGVIVKVGITVADIEHISYLPVMDFNNKAIAEDKATMMDINKAIQRATVKAIGLHGLGLYIYAGEDLPEEERKEKKTLSKTSETKTETKKVTKKTSKVSSPSKWA